MESRDGHLASLGLRKLLELAVIVLGHRLRFSGAGLGGHGALLLLGEYLGTQSILKQTAPTEAMDLGYTAGRVIGDAHPCAASRCDSGWGDHPKGAAVFFGAATDYEDFSLVKLDDCVFLQAELSQTPDGIGYRPSDACGRPNGNIYSSLTRLESLDAVTRDQPLPNLG